MLPADLFNNKNISPPFVILPGDNVVLPAEMAHGALTPQKRATTEQHSNFPVAKRLQLIHEACNDLSSGTPVSLDNNNIFNYSVNPEQIENSGDPNNIAGTPAFITTLMKFIKFSDEQRQNSIDNNKMAQQQQQYPSITTTPTAMSPKDASACANQAIWPEDSYEGNKMSSNSKLPSISNACENSMITSHNSLPSMNQIIPNKPDLCASDTEDCVFDDDDCLLNNLPTSVDDLQDMEKQIKMERHFSSPLMSHRHTPSNYDPGRLSAASGASFVFDGALSAASNHPDEELDADDLEVAMINESFEEQQRQYKLYCGDKLKSAFYSAPEESFYDSTVEHEPPVVYPITVPENEEPLYTNDSLYSHWKEESPPLSSSTYDTIAKPIVNDIFNNIIPALDDDEDSIAKSTLASLHPSIPESMDSLKLYNTSLRSDIISPPQSSFNSGGEDSFVDPEEDAIATVLSSAKFVLEEMDSPEMLDCESPLLMKSPKGILETPPLPVIDNNKLNSDESEDEAELVSAWKEIEHSGTTGDNVRYYFPRNHATPLPPPLLDKIEMIEEPPKNIKSLSHVTEIYDHNGEIDTEPALQYFQSIGMKNFYQREIDIQRAFLVFPSVNDAKFAVENNKTGLQLRLLEESPQFVKLKALKMYSELRPCCYDSPTEPHLTEMCKPWQSHSEPIAGV